MNLNLELNSVNRTNQPSSNYKSNWKVCPYCDQSTQSVFVYGHEQCVVCKTNVETCYQSQVLKGQKI